MTFAPDAAEDDIVAACHRDRVAAAIAGVERFDQFELTVGVESDLAVIADDGVAGAAEGDRVGTDAADDDAVSRPAGRSVRTR